MKRVTTWLSWLALMVWTTAAAGATWDYAQDFSIAGGNPNGAWSYGWEEGGTFHLYDQAGSASSEIQGWMTASNFDTHGNANKNVSAGSYENWGMYWEPGMTSIMPGQAGRKTVARWTAPQDMTITLDSRFTGQNVSGAELERMQVRLNGQNLFFGKIQGFNGRAENGYADRTGASPEQRYMRSLSVSAGGTIDFVVDTPDPWGSRQLGLSVGIDQTRSWDYTTDFSTSSNSSGDMWQMGYLSGPEGTLNLLPTFTDADPGDPLVRWDVGGNPDTWGNAGKNLSDAPYENWGMFWEGQQTTVMPGTAGNWETVRWTAPQDGVYKVYARWTNQHTDGRSVGVGVRWGEPWGASLFDDTLGGFIGRSTSDFSDGTAGYDYESTFFQYIEMTAGQALDFIVKYDPSLYNQTGFTATIQYVPEPSTAVLMGLAAICLGGCTLLRRRRQGNSR